MPGGFTRAFAERLDAECALEVREAADGDELRPGLALVAAGGRHLRVFRGARGALRVRLGTDPPVGYHRPSVDALFHSVAEAAGPRAAAALLTGMGSDGAAGLAALRRAGADTLAQDEATSLVWGMPGEAVERGAARRVLPLDDIASALLASAAAASGSTASPLVRPLPTTSRPCPAC
jgi:two-component system chemotaxis response regulator CheB